MKNSKLTSSEIKIPGLLALVLFILLFSAGSNLQAKENSSVRTTFKQEKPDILYIVDGEEWSAKEVDKLDLTDIEQIEHISDKEKIKLYTEQDVDMVVLITLKKEEKEQKEE